MKNLIESRLKKLLQEWKTNLRCGELLKAFVWLHKIHPNPRGFGGIEVPHQSL
jgi:hypothetical protein